MALAMTRAETTVLGFWRAWGVYARFGRCSDCGDRLYLRSSRARGPFLCVGCFDQTPAAVQFAKRLAERANEEGGATG